MGDPGTKELLSLEELEATARLHTGRKHLLSVLVDVRVSPEENCYPMIPAGQAARDMVG